MRFFKSIPEVELHLMPMESSNTYSHCRWTHSNDFPQQANADRQHTSLLGCLNLGSSLILLYSTMSPQKRNPNLRLWLNLDNYRESSFKSCRYVIYVLFYLMSILIKLSSCQASRSIRFVYRVPTTTQRNYLC